MWLSSNQMLKTKEKKDYSIYHITIQTRDIVVQAGTEFGKKLWGRQTLLFAFP